MNLSNISTNDTKIIIPAEKPKLKAKKVLLVVFEKKAMILPKEVEIPAKNVKVNAKTKVSESNFYNP